MTEAVAGVFVAEPVVTSGLSNVAVVMGCCFCPGWSYLLTKIQEARRCAPCPGRAGGDSCAIMSSMKSAIDAGRGAAGFGVTGRDVKGPVGAIGGTMVGAAMPADARGRNWSTIIGTRISDSTAAFATRSASVANSEFKRSVTAASLSPGARTAASMSINSPARNRSASSFCPRSRRTQTRRHTRATSPHVTAGAGKLDTD